jgi:hypothetical protein
MYYDNNSQDAHQGQLDPDNWTYWSSSTPANSKWSRAARFRTRVVLSRTQNGVEEQATTNWSEWSVWRSDPGGNVVSEYETTFTASGQPATTKNLYPQDSITLEADINGTNKRLIWKGMMSGHYSSDAAAISYWSYERNDWFAYQTWPTDGNLVDDEVTIYGHEMGIADVGMKQFKCLGAADWNRAKFSNACDVTIHSTSDPLHEVKIANNSMDTGIRYQIYPWDSGQGITFNPGWLIPKIKLESFGNGEIDATGNQGLYPSSSGELGSIRLGQIKFHYQYLPSYGSGAAEWAVLREELVTVDSLGEWDPPSAYTTSNYGQMRVRWCLVDMNLKFNNGNLTTYQDISTVWSNWHYYNSGTYTN